MLLDPESVESSVNTFLETFYDNYVDRLVGALADCLGPKPTSTSAAAATPAADSSVIAAAAPPPPASPSTLNLIVELLCFCVKSHSYRIKYYVLRNNVVEKVLKLTQRPERFLVVAAVRFLRACIGLKVLMLPPHRFLPLNSGQVAGLSTFHSHAQLRSHLPPERSRLASTIARTRACAAAVRWPSGTDSLHRAH